MKPHKRNGREAKERRRMAAQIRDVEREKFFDKYDKATPEERLIMAIFGKPIPEDR